jgi:hypothetical protein
VTAAPQLRYKTHRESSNFHDFAAGYMHADVADLNRDGLPDLLFTTAVKSSEPSRIKDMQYACAKIASSHFPTDSR